MIRARALSSVSVVLLLLSISATGSTMVGGNISGISFDAAGGPYVVEQDVVVPSGKKLVMHPGAVLMFKPYTGLRVEGELMVEGTAEQPVVFTSLHDADYGPETGQLPNAFDWNGVHVVAQSDGLKAKYLHVKYSVYGIKAQTDDVQLVDVTFVQNGQFHFTVNDKIQYVQDNIPYSYNVSVAEPSADTAKPDLMPKKEERVRSGSSRSKRVFRYVCLGTGVAGAALGTVFAVRAGSDADDLDDLEQANDLMDEDAAAKWQRIDDSRRGNAAAAGLSFGIGAAFLIGFGVTFFF